MSGNSPGAVGTCDTCGEAGVEVRMMLFENGAVEKVCRECLEAWALEFGGAAAEALEQWKADNAP